MRISAPFVLACVLGAGLISSGCQKGTDKPKPKKKTKVKLNTPTKTATNRVNPNARKNPTKRVPPKPKKDWSKEFPAPPDVAAAPKDAIKSKSGLAHKLVKKGKADAKKVGENDTVTMHFTVWKTSGQVYYSTHQRKRPLTISLVKAPPGWIEAVQLMTVGEKRRFWMPPELGFRKGAKNAQLLVYEIELMSVKEAPKVPKDVARAPGNALRTKSGVRYRFLKRGKKKDTANMWDQVTFAHTGWTTKGKMFDSSGMRRRTPPMFPYKLSLGQEEVLTQMSIGDKVRAWIPEKLAKMGARKIPKGMLVYDLEVSAIKRMKKPPAVPKNVAKPPANAKKTAKGVFYTVLVKGTGTAKPGKTQRVRVDYTGWTTNGRMFDSSVVRGQPSEFPLNRVIPGWTDGLATMVEGESTRFWIPTELAYKNQPNRPQGMLVFDVKLIKIK